MVGVISRDPDLAASTTYDLIVIGGGVYGVAITHHATLLGLRPLLLERDDFGGATSWNSLRILHGGIRSLQTLDVRCFKEMCLAQGWFLHHFPEHVAELECLMPLYGRGLRHPLGFRAALALNQRLRGLFAAEDRSTKLSCGTLLDVHETKRRFPLVPSSGLQAGGVWYDAVMRHPQRIIIDWLRWACAGGATALNRVSVQQLIVEDERVAGVRAQDVEAGTSLSFRAATVINCTGPWSEGISRAFDPSTPAYFRPTIAFNLLLDRPPIAQCAVALATPSGSRRTYFIVPCGDKTLVGTYHGPSAPPHLCEASSSQIEQMLHELDTAVPGWNLRSNDVVRVFSGLLPGTGRPANDGLQKSAVVRDHGRTGGPQGLFTVAGVKFTTAPLIAARVLRAAGFRSRPGTVAVSRPPVRAIPTSENFRRTLATEPWKATDWLQRLVAEESVLCVEDLLRRRTDWGCDPREERELADLIRPLLPSPSAAPISMKEVRTG